MPKIFSETRKQYLYKIIKQNCIDLIREKGYRQLNIRELAKMTGISTGTFYNFYNSKEDLILSIMEDSQHNLQNRFFKILECNGKITKSEFIDLYSFFFLKDESNIFRYLSRDDLTTILLRADRSQSFENIRTFMKKNIMTAANIYVVLMRKNINFNAVINFIQLVNLCLQNSDLLVKEEIESTVKKLLENITEQIFEEEYK